MAISRTDITDLFELIDQWGNRYRMAGWADWTRPPAQDADVPGIAAARDAWWDMLVRLVESVPPAERRAGWRTADELLPPLEAWADAMEDAGQAAARSHQHPDDPELTRAAIRADEAAHTARMAWAPTLIDMRVDPQHSMLGVDVEQG